MKNLSLYITPEDYKVFAGPDWPSYEKLIADQTVPDPVLQQEIAAFVDQQLQQGIQFPIKTATACQSKWTWSTIYLNQLSTASCHRVDLAPFSLNDFDNFHNTPIKIADRELMLQGQWPGRGCEYCRDIERAGGKSDRQHNLEIRGLTPPELETNPTATHVSPRIVEIFAQNTCNLACMYCNGNLSSKIQQENAKYGEFNQGGVKIPVITTPTVAAQEYFDRFIQWLDANIQTLDRLHLLGGETFLQRELLESVLDIIQRKPNPRLQFCIFSNLNVPDSVWDKPIARIRDLQRAGNIQVFDLTASIDCWGPESSFVRYGLDLAKFEQRLAWAAEQDSWLRLNINQTITALTIRSMPELIQKIDRYSKHKHIGHYFQFYTGGSMFHHPKNFAWSMWENDIANISAAMPTRTVEQLEAVERMQGIEKLLRYHTQHNYTEINKLHIYLDELDRRRGTNWRDLFSYLDIKP